MTEKVAVAQLRNALERQRGARRALADWDTKYGKLCIDAEQADTAVCVAQKELAVALIGPEVGIAVED